MIKSCKNVSARNLSTVVWKTNVISYSRKAFKQPDTKVILCSGVSVCQCFAVLEDGALAHNLQEQESKYNVRLPCDYNTAADYKQVYSFTVYYACSPVCLSESPHSVLWGFIFIKNLAKIICSCYYRSQIYNKTYSSKMLCYTHGLPRRTGKP